MLASRRDRRAPGAPRRARRRPDPCAGAPATVAAQQAAFATLVGFGERVVDRRRLRAGAAARRPDRVAHVRHAARATGRRPRGGRDVRAQQHRGAARPVLHAGDGRHRRGPRRPGAVGRRAAAAGRARASRGATLVVFCTEVGERRRPTRASASRSSGSALATFDLPGLTYIGPCRCRSPSPRASGGAPARCGDGDWVYVYGTRRPTRSTSRVCASIALTTGPWQFWTGSTWGDRAALAPMTFAGATPAMPAFVTAGARGTSRSRSRHRSPTRPSPAGPRPRRRDRGDRSGTVATAVTTAGQFAYDARAVDLGPAGWAIVYNVNDPVAVADDPSVYGGRFVPAPPVAATRAAGSGRDEAVQRWRARLRSRVT